jgi:hypothetical protein
MKLGQREADYRRCWPLELFIVDKFQGNIGWWDYAAKNSTTRNYFRTPSNNPAPSFLFGLFYWPLVSFDLAHLYERDLDALKSLHQPYSRCCQAFNAESYELQSCHWLSLNMNSRDETQLNQLFQVIAWGRVTQAAVRARLFREEYKRWPNSVAELGTDPADVLDPFTDGETLRIQALPSGIEIYSQGSVSGGRPLKSNTGTNPNFSNNIGWALKD